MRCKAHMILMVATLVTSAAMAAGHTRAPTYILDGYKFSQPIPGVDTDALAAKLKHKPGAHVTEDDIDIDSDMLTKELAARHIQGELGTGLVERHGHVWVIFGFLQAPEQPTRHLASQSFQGDSRIPANVLLAATGFKNGMVFSPKDIHAAWERILAVYAKALPHKHVSLKCRIVIRRNGNVELTWLIHEPK